MAVQKGTGFTNLNRILKASQGNRLGQTISGGIQQQATGVQSQIKSAQEQFEEEAQKGRLDTGEAAQKRSEILGRFAPSSGAGAVQQQPVTPQPLGPNVPGLAQTPQAGAQQAPGATQPAAGTQPAPAQAPVSEQEIQDFTKFRTGTYTGPKQLQDTQTLYGKAQQAEQLGGLARSEGGRQELLRRFVGGTGYTPGQRQLDTTLLGQQPGQLGQAARQARGATELVDRAAGQASGLAQEYTSRAKGFGEETQKMVGETREPISQALEKRVTSAQQAEEKRKKAFEDVRGILTGTAENYAGLDRMTRLGLGLQQVSDMGYLSPEQTQQLIGEGGLVQRAEQLGLDTTSLVSERLQDIIAQNLGRGGLASEQERTQLTALERLAGKQGADLEFGQPGQAFQAGRIGVDVGGLEDYIRKTEDERAARDARYAEKLAEERARYLNQAKAGAMQQIGGGMELGGAALNQVLNPQSYYNPGEMSGNIATGVQAAGNMAAGGMTASNQAANALMEGLLKLNIGGKSLAQTEGGRQLLKAIELKSKLGNIASQNVSNVAGNYAQGFRDLSSTGSWDDAAMNLSGITTMQDIARQIRGGDVGKVATNVSKSIGGAVKKLKKMFSDEDLKTDIDYSPEDLQRFMDRIKPAAYNYKDEVKDSPLASKNRELGVMAQDLEKSELGKEAVKDTKMGKVVDYHNLEPKMLASIAALNKRLKELEEKK